ncbi:MAG TPA: helical backbone metal receptor [Syntrophales bacterium]|nr:helical backbone metal receptor [Syntrophales bacterium]HOS76531.1 helical backbone metal receptor [Syntrophales bacterium]HPB69457.1 helical backbone metal receptor [Syntrophales bacterium]HQN25206.1 helical backbone metal receptor [Syntrophales bacterium]HQP28460.1 helical backbone metal receptor [Syntrophales bacterium]
MIPRKILPGTLIGFALLFLCMHAAAADPPRRIVSLAPNLTEILFDLGLADRIAGVTNYCLLPPAARGKPKVGGFVNPSLEAIIALRPDLVLLTDDGNPRAVADRLRALGIRTHVFKTGHIRDLPREIRSLGDVLAVPGRARERAETMARTFERIENRARTRGAPRMRTALFIIQPEPLIVAGKGTTMDDALALLGLVNIGAAGRAAYPKLSLESVLSGNPDVIFIARGHDDVMASADRLLKRLRSLDAVLRGRVYTVGDGILRPGPRLVDALEEMSGHLQGRGAGAGADRIRRSARGGP